MGSSASVTAISLPTGGGALKGIGEKFSPDLHTGTGNFSVPIAVPAGRHGLQPQLQLVYSTGHGNSPFGLGWALSIPGIVRKTSHGIPRYDEATDVFILSGAEDLVPVETMGTTTRYRPRTEGLFAQILHRRDPSNSYWEVTSKDGHISLYGTKAHLGSDPATIADPEARANIFAWRLTRTEDVFGNCIEYEYQRDTGEDGPHRWDQLDLSRIRYVDHGPDRSNPKFLVTVEFTYELRPDPYSDYRAGFEIRTRKRCTRISVRTHAGVDRLIRTYDLTYLDARPELAGALPPNGASLLSQVTMRGHDGSATEQLPPLEFHYTRFEPLRRNFFPVEGPDLPVHSLADPSLALVDLFGGGLPDLLEMNDTVRYWRNLGGGRFDLPRFMSQAPGGVALANPGVQLVDANGDGRTDLLVTSGAVAGYFPLSTDGGWEARSFRPYHQAPTFSLADPEVRLVDLDGDGVTDAIRSGARFECFFSDPISGWDETRWVEREALEFFPNVNFSDPRVRWADFTGDGLQDIALLSDGNVEYWPNRGYGSWGKRIHMAGSPRFPYGYDPRRILVGDIDGDGLADIVYVDDTEVTLWINQSGNRWSDPITIAGTPPVTDADAVRLVDVLGSGIGGVLWTRRADGLSPERLFFLDFTGSLKPYLLHEIDNHIGAVTKVEYAPSTRFYLEDQRLREHHWKTTVPFPVHVVSRLAVTDYFSKSTLTSEYRYHHGYWDGAEREFRGFGMVEQFDTESFAAGGVERQFYSPPTMTRTWFHQGPVGDEFGDWRELDWSDQYWPEDPPLLQHTESVNRYLATWPQTPDSRRSKRDALRALRGSVLRTELYGLDGSSREHRPYTVSESAYGIVEVEPPPDASDGRRRVFFPHLTSQRTTQWERGRDPMTSFSFSGYRRKDGDAFDPFGRPIAQVSIACPRGWTRMDDKPAEGYLATYAITEYATPTSPANYIHTRVASTTAFELRSTTGKTALELSATTETSAGLALVAHERSFYDGPAFVGLPLGQVGKHGAVTRSEALALTEAVLEQAYGIAVPPYLEPTGTPVWTADYPLEFRSFLARRAGYTFHAGSASPTDPEGYFVTTARHRYDVHTDPNGRGLVLETLDPMHDPAHDPSAHRVLTTYDSFQLLPIRVTNAAGLTVAAQHDYRVLRPAEVTDANGNTTRFAYSPAGLLNASWVRGKSAAEGDSVRPSVQLRYDFLAFAHSPPQRRQPISVRTTRHVHHDTATGVPLPDRDETITTIEYSDGFARLLQARTQDDEVRFGDPSFGGGTALLPDAQGAGAGGDVVGRLNANATQPNVVVNGWRIYDNKGRVVQQYEPFLSEGWAYGEPADEQRGQALTMFYDPRGRAIRTLMPDAAEQLVVHGVPGTIAAPAPDRPDAFEPTPWEVYSYDANDNAGRTHSAASAGYRHHWNTPSSITLDALGRTIEAVERNRDVPAVPGGPLPPIEELRTQTTYDIRGSVTTVTDPRGRIASQNLFDLTSRTLRVTGIDPGERRFVPDASGAIIETRASNAALVLSACDRLHRPIRLWARDGAGEALTLRELREYGDAGTASQPASDRAAARAANQLGRLSRVLDEAGQLSYDAYDFKANLLEKTRRVISHAKVLGVFAGPPPSWDVKAYRVDWTHPSGTPLDAAPYTSTLAYDALNRATRITYPEDAEHSRRVSVPSYNRSGALWGVELDGEVYVQRIASNAKRQRVLIAYGNGIMTRSTYDPRTFHLLRMRTERFSTPASLTYRHTGEVLQDLAYEYDLAGNVIAIHDRTPNSGINGTPLGRDALDRTFTYDAMYRLRSATGRECDHPPPVPWDSTPRCTDLTKVRAWTEEYTFDSTGNLTKLRHQSGAAATIADFTVPPAANRLSTLTQGLDVFTYEHDANGNLTREATSRHLEWDHRDKLRVYRTQTAGSEPTVHAHYLYDSTGQRVEKIVRKPGGRVEITVYIGGMFEHERIIVGGSAQENNTLLLMDDRTRVASIRVGTPFTGDATPGVRFHFSDHLGNSAVVVNATGTLVSREEYLPYGSTSFGSFARKRYRFGGYERDAESDLYYGGARYYMPWLGRWASCDPAGASDGLNLYAYVRGRPLTLADPVGLAGDDPFPPGPSREVAKEMRVIAWKKALDDALSGWNAFRTKLTYAVFDRQAYDKAKAADLPTVKPNAGLIMTDEIVKRTPDASGNAFLVMAGAVRTKAPAGGRPSVEAPAGEMKAGQQPKGATPQAPKTAPKPKPQGTVATVAAELFRLRDLALEEATQRVRSNLELAEKMTPTRFGNLVDEIFKDMVTDSIAAKRLPETFRTTATSNKGVAYGIDVYDTATGEGYDVHPANTKQVLKHMNSYEGATMPNGTVINNVNPLVYPSPWRPGP